MCAPNSGGGDGSNFAKAGGTLEIVGAVANYIGQNRAYQQNAANAVADYQRQIEGLNARAGQVEESASEDILTNALAGARARSQANLRGSSTGLSAVSTRALIQEAGFGEGRNATLINTNRDNQIDQVNRDLEGAQINTQRRVDSVKRGSPLNLALQIGAAVAGTGAKLAGIPG